MAMRLLGKGGQGEVWHLPDTEPQMVMKKVFHTNNYTSYLRELRVLKEFSHENVVRYYDPPFNYPGINSNELLLFMEYCEHLSLRHVITDVTVAYSMATIAKWSTEMFSALGYIKSKKIVHHDVKPDNLFVYGHDYIVKLGDFGIVRDLESIAKPRGGTPRYMAPEVVHGLTLSVDDVYKCDIYGAGWVVFDMVTRNPVSRAMEAVFQDRLHLNTLKKLVAGCTIKFVSERLGVEDALRLCEVMVKEFEKSHAKPDPRPDRKRLEPPMGLLGVGEEGFSQYDEILPPPICSSMIEDNNELDSELLQQKEKVDPRKRLLIELQERLGLVTAFQGTRTDVIEEYLEFYGCRLLFSMNADFFLSFLDKLKAVKPKDFNEMRRRLSGPILQKMSRLSIEEQCKCAEEMGKCSRINPPLFFEDMKYGLNYNVTEKCERFRESEKQDEKGAILRWFESLLRLDACVQDYHHLIAAKALQQIDREILPEWDSLLLLDQSIKNIEELGKLFTMRALYKLLNIENSRYSWYHLPLARLFLRADCTETRSEKLDSKEVRNYMVKEREPLNNEQLRRALVEARTHFKRKIQNQRTSSVWKSVNTHCDLRSSLKYLDNGRVSQWKYQYLLTELESVPDQPFPGYIFIDGHPPAHQCPEGECAIAGGFPRSADEKCRVPYHKCSTPEQIDYIEEYTLMLTALRYITNRKVFDPYFNDLFVNLIDEIKVKERRSVFFFAMFELSYEYEALLFQILPGLYDGKYIEKEMKLVESHDIYDVLRFVPLRLVDILPILIELSDEIQNLLTSQYFMNMDFMVELPEAVSQLWERLKAPELEGTISTTPCFRGFPYHSILISLHE